MRDLRSYPEDYSAKEALKIRKAHEDRLKYFQVKEDTDEVQNLLEDITPKKTKQRKGKRHKPEEDFGFAIEDLTLVQKAKRKRIQQKLKNKMILKKVRYQHYLARKPSKTKDIPIHPGSPAHQMGYRSNDEINILFPIPSVPRGPKLTAAQIAARRAQDRADRFKRLPKWLGQKEF